MTKSVIVLREPRMWTWRISDAFHAGFRKLGWDVKIVDGMPPSGADLYAGYGWGQPMQAAYQRHPEKLLHVDLAFWGRGDPYYKMAWNGRWTPLADRDFDGARMAKHRIKVKPARKPGRRVLVCGMSAKAAKDWGLEPEQWEKAAIAALRAAGASEVIYRAKPSWYEAKRLPGAEFDYRHKPIEETLERVDGVVSHHSNASVDALVAGLPIYTEMGLARSLSVAKLEDVIGAETPDLESRQRFLRQVAWHQWSLPEIAAAKYLEPPAPVSDYISID